MTQIHTKSPGSADVVAARRLLGLDVTATPAQVEAAVGAARAAIRVPDDAPDLAPTAAHLQRRLDHARAVLLSTLHPLPVQPAMPPPPTPPPPPLEPRPAETHSVAASPVEQAPGQEAVHPRAGVASRARKARQKRSEHTRAGVHALVVVVVLLVLGAAAFAITRALSRSGPTARGSSSTTTTYVVPTTVVVRSFADRLVSGELGRAPEGIKAASAQAAVHAWLAGYQAQDAELVSHGLDGQSRLMDLAEIGSKSSPADLEAIDCSPFGTGIWRCKVGAVTSATRRVEVVKGDEGWRVRGWIG